MLFLVRLVSSSYCVVFNILIRHKRDDRETVFYWSILSPSIPLAPGRDLHHKILHQGILIIIDVRLVLQG